MPAWTLPYIPPVAPGAPDEIPDASGPIAEVTVQARPFPWPWVIAGVLVLAVVLQNQKK